MQPLGPINGTFGISPQLAMNLSPMIPWTYPSKFAWFDARDLFFPSSVVPPSTPNLRQPELRLWRPLDVQCSQVVTPSTLPSSFIAAHSLRTGPLLRRHSSVRRWGFSPSTLRRSPSSRVSPSFQVCASYSGLLPPLESERPSPSSSTPKLVSLFSSLPSLLQRWVSNDFESDSPVIYEREPCEPETIPSYPNDNNTVALVRKDLLPEILNMAPKVCAKQRYEEEDESEAEYMEDESQGDEYMADESQDEQMEDVDDET
ncbi:hypothetical protein PIB30_091450 [Stylosanthes scabra]|uniref:Uncharacterized protein n=1 Tax=Stylosanthes scabra TaxID=79078 RepID=A0ABU6ZT69_9FABA|nr:hypothetical protein [Stylosanthes scabra]